MKGFWDDLIGKRGFSVDFPNLAGNKLKAISNLEVIQQKNMISFNLLGGKTK